MPKEPWRHDLRKIFAGVKYRRRPNRKNGRIAMSDDFHRPTYTVPGEVHGAYNASQVRLYGIPGPIFTKPGKAPKGEPPTPDVVTGVSDGLGLAFAFAKIKPSTGNEPNSVIAALSKGFKQIFRAADSSFVFIKSAMKDYMIMLGAIDVGPEDLSRQRRLSAGVIFGYAYEGHCYDLPKPKIMLIPALPVEIPSDDCGYDRKKPDYMVWIVDKLDQCIELEVSQGFIEQLVLEANLPGKRSPAMYAGRMLLGHRGGRMTE